jgi:hypothetical protein
LTPDRLLAACETVAFVNLHAVLERSERKVV